MHYVWGKTQTPGSKTIGQIISVFESATDSSRTTNEEPASASASSESDEENKCFPVLLVSLGVESFASDAQLPQRKTGNIEHNIIIMLVTSMSLRCPLSHLRKFLCIFFTSSFFFSSCRLSCESLLVSFLVFFGFYCFPCIRLSLFTPMIILNSRWTATQICVKFSCRRQ